MNRYYYGARYYDPRLSVFISVDPMAEEYRNIGGYVYTANNPINFIDPDGREIKDHDNVVANFKKEITNNINTQKELIKKGYIDSNSGEKLISFYTNILDEISKLEKSDQIYNVYLDTSNKEGGMKYDMSSGEIMISVDNNIGLVAHELHHAYQYEVGDVSLVVDNSSYGMLYDITDETNAYNRERALVTGMQFFQTPNSIVEGYPLKMSDDDVRQLGSTMTPAAYQILPNGPIGLKSNIGKQLRKKTTEAGKLGLPVKEVYKGWQKDYNKK
ncbi:RHS repeat-associated core domain-containing protein [Capnocytophaga sp. ARDL2]|uniref:RHS repeat-associated core domain-containing protein n=1 Tax=Capnocytophaga sp. ARDL2 TaxID=3238809 RepID=UPI003556D8AE